MPQYRRDIAMKSLSVQRLAGYSPRSAQTTPMFDVVCTVVTTLQAIEYRPDYRCLDSQLLTGKRTTVHLLPKLHMK
jgi:hypothetical protein